MKPLFWIISLAVFGYFFYMWVLAIVPPDPKRSQSRKVTGKVVKTEERPESKDIRFWLEGEERPYRINRGLEHSFSPGQVDSLITGKMIVVYYFTRFPKLIRNPLDEPAPHARELSVDGKIVYSEY